MSDTPDDKVVPLRLGAAVIEHDDAGLGELAGEFELLYQIGLRATVVLWLCGESRWLAEHMTHQERARKYMTRYPEWKRWYDNHVAARTCRHAAGVLKGRWATTNVLAPKYERAIWEIQQLISKKGRQELRERGYVLKGDAEADAKPAVPTTPVASPEPAAAITSEKRQFKKDIAIAAMEMALDVCRVTPDDFKAWPKKQLHKFWPSDQGEVRVTTLYEAWIEVKRRRNMSD